MVLHLSPYTPTNNSFNTDAVNLSLRVGTQIALGGLNGPFVNKSCLYLVK